MFRKPISDFNAVADVIIFNVSKRHGDEIRERLYHLKADLQVYDAMDDSLFFWRRTIHRHIWFQACMNGEALVVRIIAVTAAAKHGMTFVSIISMKNGAYNLHRPRQASGAVMRNTLVGTTAIMVIDKTHQHQLYVVGIFNRTRNSKLIKCSLIQPQASGADMRYTLVGTMSNTSIERIHHRHRNDNSENGRSLVATSRALQDIVVMTRHAMIRSICPKLNRRKATVDCKTNLIYSILVPMTSAARRSQMDSNRRNHICLQYHLESYYHNFI